MQKTVSDLMMINKIIIFIEGMIDDGIDGELFNEKINYDITFVNFLIEYFWEVVFKQVKPNEQDNFIKTYFFVLKRFYKLLYKIKNNIDKYSEYNLKALEINDIFENCSKKIKLLKEQDSRMKLSNTKNQCINTEEYSLLFEKIDDDEIK